MRKEEITNLREVIFEFCSIHHYKKDSNGRGIWYIITRNKEDGKYHYEGKKGDIKELFVFLSNDSDNSHLEYEESKDEDFYPYTFYMEDSIPEIESKEIIQKLEPLLVGQYYGTDFYLRGEMMNGTPTDETSPLDFIEALQAFNEIRRAVIGIPYYED